MDIQTGYARKIIHIDMDAFYASVEQHDNPKLRGKPIAVGSEGRRGVISTANYEARKFGVGSAMPSYIAKKKCPELVFVYPNFKRYLEVSDKVMEIFKEYTDLVEPLSLDEAFLDVTENKKGINSATYIAKEIKDKIKNKTGLTASAGVSMNKFLAKIASDYRKPDGLTVIDSEHAQKFIEKLAIEKFFGVGKATAKKMHELGIHTGLDLKNTEESVLEENFGKNGLFYHGLAWNIDDRLVEPNREAKSIGAEETFLDDLHKKEDIIGELGKVAHRVFDRVIKSNKFGRTLILKVKFSNFKQITRSKTIDEEIKTIKQINSIAKELVDKVDFKGKKIRLLGLQISNLD